MRLLFVGWGSHIHVQRWISYFAGTGDDVALVSASREPSELPDTIHVHPFHAWPSDRLNRWALARFVRRWKPDVVHVHWVHLADIAAAVWSGPLVITAWGSDIDRLDTMGPGAAERTRRLLGRADLITADARVLLDTIVDLMGDTPVPALEQVLWGVDDALFQPSATPSSLRDKLDLGDRPVVLSPRNFRPYYNLETILRAFVAIRAAVPEAVLLMKKYNPEADYEAMLTALAADLGIADAVRVLGRVDYERMPDFFRAGEITVSVPLHDATPVSLLEAMACGTVPVVSDLPAMHDWITDGVNGRIVPVHDHAALAAAVIALLRDPETRARMRAHNLALVRERGTMRANMERMRTLYRDVVDRHHRQ